MRATAGLDVQWVVPVLVVYSVVAILRCLSFRYRFDESELVITTGDNIYTFDWAWAPRLSAVYDVLGNGRHKASFYYGRYYDPVRNDMTNFAGTLTGSIGVVAGKLATGQAWRRLGINWDELHQGRNATFMVPDEPYTDSERERLQAGCRGQIEETPKPGDERLARCETHLIARPQDALEAAAAAARDAGVTPAEFVESARLDAARSRSAALRTAALPAAAGIRHQLRYRQVPDRRTDCRARQTAR